MLKTYFLLFKKFQPTFTWHFKSRSHSFGWMTKKLPVATFLIKTGQPAKPLLAQMNGNHIYFHHPFSYAVDTLIFNLDATPILSCTPQTHPSIPTWEIQKEKRCYLVLSSLPTGFFFHIYIPLWIVLQDHWFSYFTVSHQASSNKIIQLSSRSYHPDNWGQFLLPIEPRYAEHLIGGTNPSNLFNDHTVCLQWNAPLCLPIKVKGYSEPWPW